MIAEPALGGTAVGGGGTDLVPKNQTVNYRQHFREFCFPEIDLTANSSKFSHQSARLIYLIRQQIVILTSQVRFSRLIVDYFCLKAAAIAAAFKLNTF
jgi:hypothetical protein